MLDDSSPGRYLPARGRAFTRTWTTLNCCAPRGAAKSRVLAVRVVLSGALEVAMSCPVRIAGRRMRATRSQYPYQGEECRRGYTQENSSAVRDPVRSGERALCSAVHGGEKINGGVVASGSAADFAGPGKSRDEPVAHGGQKHACPVPRGVCEEQG